MRRMVALGWMVSGIAACAGAAPRPPRATVETEVVGIDAAALAGADCRYERIGGWRDILRRPRHCANRRSGDAMPEVARARRDSADAAIAAIRTVELREMARERSRGGVLDVTGPTIVIFYPASDIPRARGEPARWSDPALARLAAEGEGIARSLRLSPRALGTVVEERYTVSLQLVRSRGGGALWNLPPLDPHSAGYLLVAPELPPQLRLGLPDDSVVFRELERLVAMTNRSRARAGTPIWRRHTLHQGAFPGFAVTSFTMT